MPGVKQIERGLDQYVPSFPGVTAGIVVPAVKGDINKPRFVSSPSQFLKYFTANNSLVVGDHTSHYSALNYLNYADALYVVRSANGALYGSALVDSVDGSIGNRGLGYGMVDPTAYNFQKIAEEFTVDSATDELTVTQDYYTGEMVVLSTSDTLPAPLSVLTDYYVIRVDATTIKLAASASDAEDGVVIDITDTGTGDHTITVSDSYSDVMLVYGANEGDYNNDVYYAIHNYISPETFTVVSATSTLTVTQEFSTGEYVKVSGATLPDSLDADNYYVIRVDDTSIKLATSYNNAIAGTSISFLEPGSGNIELVDKKSNTEGHFLIEVYTKSNLSTPVESFEVSRDPNSVDGFGNNSFIEERLKASNYIRAISNPYVDESVAPKAQIFPKALSGGDDGEAVTDEDIAIALQVFKNKNDLKIFILMDGGWATPAVATEITQIAQLRMDCVGILSTPISAEMNNDYIGALKNYRLYEANINSSYVAMYTGWIRITDRYTKQPELFIAPDSFAAAAISQTSYNYEPWYAPAGNRRGVIVAQDVYNRYTDAEIEELYKYQINANQFKPGKGIRIWGQKTMLSTPADRQALNVRLLLNVIEPAIAEALEDFVFEFNDEPTRGQIRSLINNYMTGIQNRRGVYSFQVICNEDNNDASVISAGEMNVWLLVKATRVAETINFVTGVVGFGTDFSIAAESL